MKGLRGDGAESGRADSSRGSFLRATAVLAGGTALGQSIPVLASLLVSRLYGPAQVGTLGVFATVVSFLAPVACLRYEAAITIPAEGASAARLLVASLLSAFWVSVATALAVLAFGGPFAELCKDPELKPLLWFLPVTLLGVGLYQAFNYWAVRQERFGLIAGTKVVQGLTQALCQVVLGFFRAGSLGLVLGDVLGRVSGGGGLFFASVRQEPSLLRQRLDSVAKTAKEYAAFPLVSGPATIFHTATTTCTLVIAALYSPVVYAHYFAGVRWVWAPVALVAQALAQVYIGQASRWAREDPAHMLKAFDAIVRRLALAGLVPFGVLAVAGTPVITFLFGPEWRLAGEFVQVQAFSWWVMFTVGPVLATLNILRRLSWQLWADAVAVALMAGGFGAASWFRLGAHWAVGLYSMAIVVLYVWLYLACRRAVVLAKDGAGLLSRAPLDWESGSQPPSSSL